MLNAIEDLETTYRNFEWHIPKHFNMGVDVCDRIALERPNSPAIIEADETGRAKEYSFEALRLCSNRLANGLRSLGIKGGPQQIGDRVAVLLPQSFQTAVAQVAILKSGCISLPLFSLFKDEALLHRLKDSGANAIITNYIGAAKIRMLQNQLPDLAHIISIDGESDGVLCFRDLCESQSGRFEAANTLAEDPALLIYTSGTTGNPKGALHAHRVLLGHLPGVEMSHNYLPGEGDRFWTPADWAWIGGLMNVLMCALHHGIPVVACRFQKFTGKAAFEFMRDLNIRNTFLPPTALKMMRLVPDAEEYGLKLRSIASGGESLGNELTEWGRKVFGTTINEFYGQTECNMVVSSCHMVEDPVPGSMGWAVPGHVVKVIDPDSGEMRPHGEEGEIAVLSPDPVMFLEYWNRPDATTSKYVDGSAGRWILTGDCGIQREDGRFVFLGRMDDVITSGGYRIGPGEVEDCLIQHPAVELAGVVGKPDPVRGSTVSAYIRLAKHHKASERLADEIAEFVKNRLAAHEYPRSVRFIDKMPMTNTGKIIRKQLREMASQEAAREVRRNG